ncbi:hypothetical protein [Bifidobacterium panos]|uniref:Uncharacterized protein n=1 Tax=Bifidobacterium panos TaxID=2675321 RepID=A0ABX1T122_9BIFI|nr:hypothetical protein [Bifidobacterium sp. DSM 109963]NMN02722.1 hypothetical protein [Bifidobacterium sp. DSM 109963]
MRKRAAERILRLWKDGMDWHDIAAIAGVPYEAVSDLISATMKGEGDVSDVRTAGEAGQLALF